MRRLAFLHPNFESIFFSGCYGNWPSHVCSSPVLHRRIFYLFFSTVTQEIIVTVIQHEHHPENKLRPGNSLYSSFFFSIFVLLCGTLKATTSLCEPVKGRVDVLVFLSQT